MTIFKNLDGENFQQQQTIESQLGNVNSVYAADFNNDKKMDIVIAVYKVNTLQFYLQHSDGNTYDNFRNIV